VIWGHRCDRMTRSMSSDYRDVPSRIFESTSPRDDQMASRMASDNRDGGAIRCYGKAGCEVPRLSERYVPDQ